MALHPGSLTSAYAALQVYGFDAGTMRNACEQAAYRGMFRLSPVVVTFSREDGYRVVATFARNPSASYLASLAAEQAAGRTGTAATQPQGPHADVYAARTVTHGWHMEGVGTVEYVYTHLDSTVTLGGPLGFRTFGLDALVEATPAAAQEPASDAPAMIALPPLAVTKLASTLAQAELGGGYALGRLYVQANRDGSAVIYLAS